MLPSTHVQESPEFLTISQHSATPHPKNIGLASKTAAFAPTMFEIPSLFHYNNRIRLSFAVRNTYKADFVMIRGLIEFHRPKELTFTYDRVQRTVTVDVDGDKLKDLESFLVSVYTWLKQEKQFRVALKLVIELERRHRLEAESVYGILKRHQQ